MWHSRDMKNLTLILLCVVSGCATEEQLRQEKLEQEALESKQAEALGTVEGCFPEDHYPDCPEGFRLACMSYKLTPTTWRCLKK